MLMNPGGNPGDEVAVMPVQIGEPRIHTMRGLFISVPLFYSSPVEP